VKLGEKELPAVRAAAAFFSFDRLLGDDAAATSPSFFRRGDAVHLLTAAAAAMADGRGLSMVSCGAAVLEAGVGKKQAVQLQLQAAAAAAAAAGGMGSDGGELGGGVGGGGYVVPQAALALGLRWIDSSSSGSGGGRRRESSGRVLVLSRQGMLELLQAKRSGAHGGKLKCAPASAASTCSDGESVDSDSEDDDSAAAVLGEAMVARICGMPAGGCIAVCMPERQPSREHQHQHQQQQQPLALSCWKSDPYWLQVSGNDKAALARVGARLGSDGE
jgi:hypothetical protein